MDQVIAANIQLIGIFRQRSPGDAIGDQHIYLVLYASSTPRQKLIRSGL